MRPALLWGAILAVVMAVATAASPVETTGKLESGIDTGQMQWHATAMVGLKIGLGRKVVLLPYYEQDVILDLENIGIMEKNIVSNEYEAGALLYFGNVYVGWVHSSFHPENSEQIFWYKSILKVGVEW